MHPLKLIGRIFRADRRRYDFTHWIIGLWKSLSQAWMLFKRDWIKSLWILQVYLETRSPSLILHVYQWPPDFFEFSMPVNINFRGAMVGEKYVFSPTYGVLRDLFWLLWRMECWSRWVFGLAQLGTVCMCTCEKFQETMHHSWCWILEFLVG